jgi:hypothetical protein
MLELSFLGMTVSDQRTNITVDLKVGLNGDVVSPSTYDHIGSLLSSFLYWEDFRQSQGSLVLLGSLSICSASHDPRVLE